MTGSVLLTIVASVLAAQTGVVDIDSASRGNLEAVEPDLPAKTAYVAGTDGSCLNLRSLPESVSPVLTCLPEGAIVKVIETAGDWQKARLDDGRQGWLAARFLSVTAPTVAAVDPTQNAGNSKEIVEDQLAAPAPRMEEPAPKVSTEELGAQLADTEVAIRQLLGEVDSSRSALDEAERNRSELSRRLLETTVTDLESRLARALSDLESAEGARVALSGQLEEFGLERRDLERRLEEALLEGESAKIAGEQTVTELVSAHADLERVRAERDQLEVEMAEVRPDLTRADQERERLLAELEATTSEVAQFKTVANAAEEALKKSERQSETALAALQEQLERREEEIAENRARLGAVEAERAAIAAEADQFGARGKSSLKRELKQTRLELQELAREKQALEVWLSERGQELDRAEARVAIMQSEIDRLESASPGDRREIEGTRAALNEARLHAAELDGRLAASENENRALQAELESTRRELSELQASQPASDAPAEDLASQPAMSDTEVVVLQSAAPCLKFRAEPKLDSEAFDCLEPGTQVGPLGHWEGWHYVELADGRAGWVASQHLGPLGIGGSGP